MQRRAFLQRSISSLFVIKMGLLWSQNAIAAVKEWPRWPVEWFSRTTPNDALCAVFGDREIMVSNQILIDMPLGAENGAIVPVTITTDLPSVQSISLIGDKNPISLISQFRFAGQARGDYLRTRIKLAGSSNLIVVVESDGALLSARRHIEVLKGGCD